MHLAYYNWLFPTAATTDLIKRQNLTQRQGANHHCPWQRVRLLLSQPLHHLSRNQLNVLLRLGNQLMPRAWINPQRLILTGCMFIQLFNAGGIANDVVFLLGLIEYFLYSNPLQIPRHAQQLQHGRRTQPWHRPPGARQRQLPLPLLLEGDHRERTVGGIHAPGRHQPYDCEEKVLEGPRRLEFLANPAHGPIQKQSIPRALLTERD